MRTYRRLYVPNGTYFFTVVTHNRAPLFADPNHVARLYRAIEYARQTRPFRADALVILPDHLHCIWTLSEDRDFSRRWWSVKTHFSRHLRRDHAEPRAKNWQDHFWEHLIRDENDLRRHLDYIHYNPVKHGYANRPADWPYSSFGQFAAQGYYAPDWGNSAPNQITDMDPE